MADRPTQDRWRGERPKAQPRRRPDPSRNTHPRGNPELNVRDLNRSIDRFEMLLGR